MNLTGNAEAGGKDGFSARRIGEKKRGVRPGGGIGGAGES